MKKLFLAGLFLLFVAGSGGCAGPTTPLGAISSLTPGAARQKALLTAELQKKAADVTASKIAPEQVVEAAPAPDNKPAVAMATLRTPQARPVRAPATQRPKTDPKLAPAISFWPRHLVLHGRAPLRIRIEDPTAADLAGYKLIVRYNGADVTSSFLLRASVEHPASRRSLLIENPSIRLAANRDHEIEVFYVSPSGAVSYAQYENPKCYAFRPRSVETLGDFDPEPPIVSSIERFSKAGGVSPAFFAALVAQESGFNPRVVSWAKALGLTQITSSAEADFIAKYSSWPRNPQVASLPVPMLRALILAGKMNPANEWRLDADKSIQGGIDYAILLAERWSTPDRLARIRALFADPEQAHTQLVLASYHSGFTRVLAAFDSRGREWIYSPELREARKYVNRIASYCDYFSAPQATQQSAWILEQGGRDET
jgi:hypothetical protein